MSIENKKAKAEIKDATGKENVVLEVNFDDSFKDCVKIVFGTEHRIIKYSDLFTFMFFIATPEQQEKMIPVREELGIEYMKQVRIKCKKDMKEGEELVVNIKIHVPTVVAESVKKDIESPYLQKD